MGAPRARTSTPAAATASPPRPRTTRSATPTRPTRNSTRSAGHQSPSGLPTPPSAGRRGDGEARRRLRPRPRRLVGHARRLPTVLRRPRPAARPRLRRRCGARGPTSRPAPDADTTGYDHPGRYGVTGSAVTSGYGATRARRPHRRRRPPPTEQSGVPVAARGAGPRTAPGQPAAAAHQPVDGAEVLLRAGHRAVLRVADHRRRAVRHPRRRRRGRQDQRHRDDHQRPRLEGAGDGRASSSAGRRWSASSTSCCSSRCSTVGSIIYNLCADLVGGVEVTLSEA